MEKIKNIFPVSQFPIFPLLTHLFGCGTAALGKISESKYLSNEEW